MHAGIVSIVMLISHIIMYIVQVSDPEYIMQHMQAIHIVAYITLRAQNIITTTHTEYIKLIQA